MRDSALDVRFAQRSAELIKQCHDCLLDSEIASPASAGASLINLAEAIDLHLEKCSSQFDGTPWKLMAISLRSIVCQTQCRRMARTGETGLIEARHRLAILLNEARETIFRIQTISLRDTLLTTLGTGEEILDTTKFVNCLQAVPLPVSYMLKQENPFSKHSAPKSETLEREPSVIKVIAFLDRVPLVMPQLVRPNTLYSLSFRIRGENWLQDATTLSLDLLTTCPLGIYTASKYTLPRPQQLDRFEGDLEGHITFHAPQSVLSDNLVFTVRCAYKGGKKGVVPVRVIGHTEAHFRVDNPEHAQLTTHYKNMDLHLSELVRKLSENCPAANQELTELMPVLTALATVQGAYAQSGVFKGVTKLTELELQKKVTVDLRLLLGQDLQEHPHQAGGITDLHFRGVVIELKVEDTNGDRSAIANKYCSQL